MKDKPAAQRRRPGSGSTIPTRRDDGVSKPTPDGCTVLTDAAAGRRPILASWFRRCTLLLALSTCQEAHTPPPIVLRPCGSMSSLAPVLFAHAPRRGAHTVRSSARSSPTAAADRRTTSFLLRLVYSRVTNVTKKKCSEGREKTITRGAPRARGERAASGRLGRTPPRREICIANAHPGTDKRAYKCRFSKKGTSRYAVPTPHAPAAERRSSVILYDVDRTAARAAHSQEAQRSQIHTVRR